MPRTWHASSANSYSVSKRPRFWNIAPMNAASLSRATPPSSLASMPAISARRNSSFSWLACAWSCMCSSSTRLVAGLRMPAMPISATARETVLTLPPALETCAVLTSRSSLFVSATSFRISLTRLPMLRFSEWATGWMRATESDSVGSVGVRRRSQPALQRVAECGRAWPAPRRVAFKRTPQQRVVHFRRQTFRQFQVGAGDEMHRSVGVARDDQPRTAENLDQHHADRQQVHGFGGQATLGRLGRHSAGRADDLGKASSTPRIMATASVAGKAPRALGRCASVGPGTYSNTR